MMRYYLPCLAIFVLMVWIPVEGAFHAWCFNNFDLGIYAQAIHELSLANPNPWLSVRNIHLLRDHFEPVFYLLLPFKNLTLPGLLAIRLDMLATVVASLAPIWLARRQFISIELAVCSATVILLGPLGLDATYFSAHPGTWSLAPLAWMFAFLLVENHKAAMLCFVLTLFCKEEYPVMGFALAAAMLTLRQRKSAIAFLTLSAVWAVIVFVVRPAMLGPSDFHTNTVAHGEGVQFFLSTEGLKVLAIRHLELILPAVLLISTRGLSAHWKQFVIPGAALVTLLAIRYAGGYWGNHRVAPLGVTSVFLVIFYLRDKALPRRIVTIFACALLALSFADIETGSRYWRGKPFKKHCPANSERLAALDLAAGYLRAHRDGAVLAGGNLIPPLVDLAGIAHVGDTQATEFKYLFLEKGPLRNPWPITPDELTAVEVSWRQNPSSRVIQDDDYVLLIER